MVVRRKRHLYTVCMAIILQPSILHFSAFVHYVMSCHVILPSHATYVPALR